MNIFKKSEKPDFFQLFLKELLSSEKINQTPPQTHPYLPLNEVTKIKFGYQWWLLFLWIFTVFFSFFLSSFISIFLFFIFLFFKFVNLTGYELRIYYDIYAKDSLIDQLLMINLLAMYQYNCIFLLCIYDPIVYPLYRVYVFNHTCSFWNAMNYSNLYGIKPNFLPFKSPSNPLILFPFLLPHHQLVFLNDLKRKCFF